MSDYLAERTLNLAAENDRLRQQVADSRDLLQAKDAAIDDLGEQVERLQARLDTATAHVEELRGQRDEQRARAEGALGKSERLYRRFAEVRAERDLMRPVVEAAEAFVVADRGSGGFARAKAGTALFAAVDAWRVAQPDQKAPTDRPSATDADCGCSIGAEHTCGRMEAHGVVAPVGDGLNQPLTTDPPGLAEAIEEATDEVALFAAMWEEEERASFNEMLARAVRAAEPILAKAALLEAADELKAEATRVHDLGGDYNQSVAVGIRGSEWTLRERADRIGGGE
jgi:hypothetical protein